MDTQQTIDEQFMQEALALAAQARGRTSPNPMVGSVVVKDGRVVGDFGYVSGRAPREHVFRDALRAELDRMRTFLEFED